MSSYPTLIWDPDENEDDATTVDADYMTERDSEIKAIETALGINLAVNPAYPLSSRLRVENGTNALVFQDNATLLANKWIGGRGPHGGTFAIGWVTSGFRVGTGGDPDEYVDVLGMTGGTIYVDPGKSRIGFGTGPNKMNITGYGGTVFSIYHESLSASFEFARGNPDGENVSVGLFG